MSTAPTPDTYTTINAACHRFGISRSTFYRMLADPSSGLAELIIRIPPGTGRIRVPLQAFERWLCSKRRCRPTRHAQPS